MRMYKQYTLLLPNTWDLWLKRQAVEPLRYLGLIFFQVLLSAKSYHYFNPSTNSVFDSHRHFLGIEVSIHFSCVSSDSQWQLVNLSQWWFYIEPLIFHVLATIDTHPMMSHSKNIAFRTNKLLQNHTWETCRLWTFHQCLRQQISVSDQTQFRRLDQSLQNLTTRTRPLWDF